MEKLYCRHGFFTGLPKGLALFAALLALLWPAPPARAQQAEPSAITWGNFSPFLTLSDDIASYDAAPFIYVTADPERKFAYKDIYERHISGLRGAPARGSVLALGSAAVPHWIVFSVENKSWNENWVMSFGQHLDGRLGTLRQIFLYEHFSRVRYIDNITPQKNNYVARVKEIEPYAPVTIGHGKKALFVMLVEPSPGNIVTLMPRLMTAAAHDKATRGPFNKTVLTGFFFLMMAGIFMGAYIFERYYSCLLLALYYFVQSALLYYQNNTLYVDFPFSAHVSDILAASTGLIGLLATKSLLRVGAVQRAQGHGVTAFIAGQFFAAVVGSFVIPEHLIARPLVVYGALFASYLLLALTSFAQSYRDQPGSYRFAAAWGLVAAGLFTSMAGASGYFSAADWVVAAYWYSLVPQGILLASAAVGIILFERNEKNARVADEAEERERLDLFRQSKESTEINRLRKLIDHEREVMNELREREVRQNDEMRKAKDAADEANRAKSAFLAVISHEIRTPMTGIMGMVRLLQETSLSSEQREYSQTIQDSGDAMVSLLNDILDFEKIESGKMDLEHLDFDLPRLLNGVVTLMSGHAAAKGISLKIDMDPNIPRYVMGDPVRLRQVLLNLTGNSIKFTSEGGVTLQARLEQSATMRKIYFGIRDTGIGISKAAQKNLFSPFAQADSTITRKFGGTGLGLAISQRLIEAMGGRIRIDSTEGHGSTFFFTLAMEEGNAERATQQGGAAAGSRMQKSEKSLRVLIVEDNEINLRLLKEFVDRMGHGVTPAGSGEEAMKILAEKDFDMILMDIELPGMSGMGTTKAIRALPDGKKAATPVIALSGNVRSEDVSACYAANMNGHLSKPVDPKRLKQMIDKVINGNLDNPVIVEGGKVEVHVQVNKITPFHTARNETPAPASGKIMTAESLGIASRDMDEDSFDAALKIMDEKNKKPAPGGKDIFDPGQLLGLRSSMNAVAFAGLVDSLLVKSDEIVAYLSNLPCDTDKAEVIARAHELKGMAGNYGLKELAAAAAVLEKAAREGRGEDIPDLLAALPDVNNRARAALEAWQQ